MEPLADWLLQLAAGNWEPAAQGASAAPADEEAQGSRTSSPVLFPLDLRYYCGQRWHSSLYHDLIGKGDNGNADSGKCIGGQACGSSSSSSGGDSCSSSVVCCFLSGVQCSSCAASTARQASAGLDEQLLLCQESLKGIRGITKADKSHASCSDTGADICGREKQTLLDEQLQELMQAIRLFHLQQPCWYDSNVQDTGAGHIGGGSSSSSNGCAVVDAAPWPHAAQHQLLRVQQQLQPLRDVAAVREI